MFKNKIKITCILYCSKNIYYFNITLIFFLLIFPFLYFLSSTQTACQYIVLEASFSTYAAQCSEHNQPDDVHISSETLVATDM